MAVFCSVTGCNSRLKHRKEGNITFHHFPKDEALCQLWISATGRKNWHPDRDSRICSKHFDKTCFTTRRQNNNTLRPVLRTGSKPFLYHNICRVCLATDEKMFSLREDHRAAQYEQVTGLNVGHDDQIPLALCWECAHRLAACYKFRARARLAHCLMEDLLRSNLSITEENISNIDRKKLGLDTKLVQINITPDYFDLKVEEDEDEIAAAITAITEDWETKGPETETLVKVEPKNEPDETYMEIETLSETETHDDAESHYETETHNDTEADFGDDTNALVIDTDDKKSLDEDNGELKIDSEEVDSEKRDTKVKNNHTIKSDSNDEKTHMVLLALSKKIFEVVNLNDEEQLVEFEKRKELRTYQAAKYKCELCYRGYMDDDAYKFHKLLHTDQNGLVECSLCKMRFSTKNSCRKHEVMHLYLYKCKLCEFVAQTRSQALRHQDFHKGVTYPCQYCEKIFTRETTYLNHVRKKHPCSHVCTRCGLSFVGKKGLEQHWSRKHRFDDPAEPPEEHPCSYCDLKFESISALHHHICNYHPEEAGPDVRRTVKAAESKRKKAYVKNYLDAYRSRRGRYTPKEPFQCEQCEVVLRSAREYFSHFRREHRDKNRTYFPVRHPGLECMCELCGKTFSDPHHLNAHMDSHAPEKRYACELCGRRFQQRFGLIQHMVTHSENRPRYPCEYCGKTFVLSSNRNRHMFSHTGEKPYKCGTCGKVFAYKNNLQQHERHVHANEPWPMRVRSRRARPRTPEEVPDEEVEWGEEVIILEE